MSVKKKAIWLFSGGTMQIHAAKKIIEFGYKLILTDIDVNCVCSKYADEFINLDTFDVTANIDEANRLKSKYQISAVITIAADCHETVAILAKHLELTGINPNIAHICRNKNLTRERLTSAGLPQPKFACVDNLSDAKSFLSSIGNKGVIKATDNSASRGFSKINFADELNEKVFEIAVKSGSTGSVLVEEEIIPIKNDIAELSVETLWFEGKMYWLNWVDRLFRDDLCYFPSLREKKIPMVNWGVEVGHINPAEHSESTKTKTENMVFEAGSAIGMCNEVGGHILKADIMLTSDGPVIIELTPRLSGGWDSSATTLERGADFQSGVIQLALGNKLNSELWNKYFDFKQPNLYASIWADIPSGAVDCIGRRFSLGTDFDRDKSLLSAYNNSLEKKYVI